MIAYGSLFLHLGSLPLSGADEPRYAQIAREMHESGNWVTPTLQGKPWMEKPPLYYWITSPLFYFFKSAETAARTGPAVCALVAAIAVFYLGAALCSNMAGALSAVILLASLGYAGFGRSASTDMPFTCCFTIAMALLAAAARKDIGPKVLAAYVFLGLSVLGKGPVAIILAVGIGLCFWYWDERGGLIRRWLVMPGAVVCAAISIPWFWLAFRQNGYSFIATFFINHNIARFVTDIHHHSQPFYYYIPVLLALMFPWSGWLLLLILRSPVEGLRRWRQWDPSTVFLTCWFLVPIIFFSLSDSKLAGYILPSLPPLALILGIHLSRKLEGNTGLSGLRAAMGLHLALSAAMAIAAPIYFQKECGGSWKVGVLLSVAIMIPAVFAFGFGLRGSCMRAFKATALQGLIVLISTVLFAFPVLGAYHTTREIAYQALNLRKAGELIATYRFFHHSLFYYTGYQIAEELNDSEELRKFAQTHPNSLVVTEAIRLRDISGSAGLSVAILGRQGDLILLRISPK